MRKVDCHALALRQQFVNQGCVFKLHTLANLFIADMQEFDGLDKGVAEVAVELPPDCCTGLLVHVGKALRKIVVNDPAAVSRHIIN